MTSILIIYDRHEGPTRDNNRICLLLLLLS